MIGKSIGSYQIVAKLGEGGMGEVYRATDINLARQVAIKVLPEGVASDPERLARFDREARTLAALNHPNIAQIYGLERSDGPTALVMELVDGPTLADRIAQGAVPPSEALSIAKQIAEALDAAHERGIIHRDLKPANIKVRPDGTVKVLDFGLAKALSVDRRGMTDSASMSPTSTAPAHTQQGVILGTPAYMSPEQAKGEPVDARSDIFSFGVLLYELLSGRRPFTGNSTIDTLAAVVRDEPPPLAAPPQLTTVVGRCVQKAPLMRYQSMAEVRAALDDVSGVLARASRPDETPSIAVLPFANLSADKENEYFADGLAEELLNLLARIRGLKVIARTSSFAFRGKEQDITAIAAALRVRHILEGSVRRAGTRVRVTAQLIAAADGSHVWSERYDRDVTDVFAIQDEISEAISTALRVRLAPRVNAEAQGTPSVDPEAYDAYLKGRFFFNRPSDENLQKAIARFEEAIALDPHFVPALSGLSDAYLWAGFNEGFMSASEARPRARAAAEEAIRLDAQSAEAHTSMAVFKLFYECDRKGAEAEFRRALALNSNYSYAHDQFALGLAFQGRFEESIAESRRAAELDPLNPVIPIDAAVALVWRGDREAAWQQVRRAADLDPTFFFTAASFGWIDLQSGKMADAIGHLQQAKTMGAPTFVTAWLAYAYGMSGDRDRALAEAEDLKRGSRGGRVTPFNSALVAIGLGDHARAVSLLEQAHALDSQWLGWLKNDRIFNPLRPDPRFRALLKKLGFEG